MIDHITITDIGPQDMKRMETAISSMQNRKSINHL
jgi:hypothetical protein